MSKFWDKWLVDIGGGTIDPISLPACAKVQIGESGVYPWEAECKKQLEGLGSKALSSKKTRRLAGVSAPKIKGSLSAVEIMAAYDRLIKTLGTGKSAENFGFRARRLPRRVEPAGLD